jgi:hypothetical protein
VNDVVGVVGHVLLVDVSKPVVSNVVVGVSFVGDGGSSEVLHFRSVLIKLIII